MMILTGQVLYRYFLQNRTKIYMLTMLFAYKEMIVFFYFVKVAQLELTFELNKTLIAWYGILFNRH